MRRIKRIYQSIIIAVCLVCYCWSFAGCSLNYSLQTSPDGDFTFGISHMGKDAFCSRCVWDGGENTSFVIPDEFMGRKVTALGGHIGSGYPCPFTVMFDVEKIYPEDEDYGVRSSIGSCKTLEDCFTENLNEGYDVLPFCVHLGVNIVQLKNIIGKQYLIRNIKNEDGVIEYTDVLCKIVYSFTVDEGNSKFYAENGRLYYCKNNRLVTDFFYE